MNVLFLIPPSPGNRRIIRLVECSHEAKADYLWQPYDYMLISSLLRPEDRARLIDGTADRLEETEFLRQTGAEEPDLVFFTLSSICWDWDLRLFTEVRARFPRTPLYLVGDIFLEDDYLEFILPRCEGVVFQPQLLDLPAMVAGARRGNTDLPGLRGPGGPREVAAKSPIPAPPGVPRHELFQKKGYLFPFARHRRFATVSTSWGCPFSCSYCNQRGIPPVVRPWREVVRELAQVEGLGIRELFFADKAFGYPPSSAAPLLTAMRDRFRFSWSCYFHPQMYKPDLLDLMRAAGCHTLIIGLESADLPGLARFGRRVDPGRVEGLLGHARGLGMSVCADFILGLEHETEEDMERTLRQALRWPIDFASFNLAAPLPGSGIRERTKAEGRMAFGKEGFDTLAREGALSSPRVTQDRLLAMRSRAVRSFYLRPRHWLRLLGKTASLEHLVLELRQMATMLRKS